MSLLLGLGVGVVSRIRVSWTRISPAAPSGSPGIFMLAGAWGFKSTLAGGDLKLRLVGGSLIATTGTATGRQLSMTAGQLTA